MGGKKSLKSWPTQVKSLNGWRGILGMFKFGEVRQHSESHCCLCGSDIRREGQRKAEGKLEAAPSSPKDSDKALHRIAHTPQG